MMKEQMTRARNCILGALVADAATMGFHWLYSRRRIRALAPDQPEFRNPTAADYEGNVGYFAHAHKTAGELSHYGEQCWVMLHSLVENGNCYEKEHYQESFRQHFGYGGAFAGYIDRPTRETLDHIYRAEGDALALVNEIEVVGEPRLKQGLLTKVLAAAKRYSGDRLREQAELFARESDRPRESLQYTLLIVAALEKTGDFPGALDEQLPAVSKLPALVALYADDPELLELSANAVKVTNNATRALDYGRVSTRLLQKLVQGEGVESAIVDGLAEASEATREHLETVLTSQDSVPDVTAEFGMHCDLGSGVPSVVYNLRQAQSFEDAVRQNIYAGGDNCGRAILLGAAGGAIFGMGGSAGIPAEWVDRLSDRHRILGQIDQLFPDQV